MPSAGQTQGQKIGRPGREFENMTSSQPSGKRDRRCAGRKTCCAPDTGASRSTLYSSSFIDRDRTLSTIPGFHPRAGRSQTFDITRTPAVRFSLPPWLDSCVPAEPLRIALMVGNLSIPDALWRRTFDCCNGIAIWCRMNILFLTQVLPTRSMPVRRVRAIPACFAATQHHAVVGLILGRADTWRRWIACTVLPGVPAYIQRSTQDAGFQPRACSPGAVHHPNDVSSAIWARCWTT